MYVKINTQKYPKNNGFKEAELKQKEENRGVVMEGKIKWFSSEKGYGFITVESLQEDIFFHVSEYRSQEQIHPWDKVKFEIGAGRNGKSAAKNVEFISRGDPPPSNKPYYGKKAILKCNGISGVLRYAGKGAEAGGPIGMIVGGIIGAMSSPKEITSTCLKCGGKGHITALDEHFVGFQCERCKSFWRKRNKINLTMDELDIES